MTIEGKVGEKSRGNKIEEGEQR